MPKSQELEITVILNNIRSSENVGSIFRTCDAAGVKKIMLCGYTPAPVDRFGRENKGLTKASLGAEGFVSWKKFENLEEAVWELRNPSFRSQMLRIPRSKKGSSAPKVVAIEQDKNSIDYREIKQLVASSEHLALVFGNEVEGLSQEDLQLCDMAAEIPMHGRKESLNVSVSAGIILFALV